MRKSEFSEAEDVAIHREGQAGVPAAEILRKHGISRPTAYLRMSKYGHSVTPSF